MLGHTYVHLLAPACTRLHLLAPAHTFRTRAGVRTCEFSHIRTFTHISKNFFAKQNSGSHTMHVAHILHACGCADVRNFAHPHFHTHIQNFFCKKKTLAATPCTLHTFCKRAGVRTCEISHICTFAHISTIFFAKKTPARTLQVDVRKFANSHFRTHFHIFFEKTWKNPR